MSKENSLWLNKIMTMLGLQGLTVSQGTHLRSWQSCRYLFGRQTDRENRVFYLLFHYQILNRAEPEQDPNPGTRPRSLMSVTGTGTCGLPTAFFQVH